ncbi:MAG: lysophospholipid acyltransferase family protein [Myxococcota bacterium]
MSRWAFRRTLVGALAALLRTVPVGWGWPFVAWLAVRLADKRQRIAAGNLHAAFRGAPPTDPRRVFVHLIRTAGDFVRLPQHRRNGFTAVRIEDLSPLRALKSGGAILATGHLGSWELALAALAFQTKVPLAVVVKRLGWIDDWVNEERKRSGLLTIPVDRASTALRGIVSALDEGRGVVMVIDQHAPDGRVLPFFGLPAATTDVPVRLALRRRRPLLWLSSWREESGGHVITIDTVWTPDETIDPAALLIRLNARLEGAIRAHPTQWLWTHRRWKVRTPTDVPSDEQR